VSVTAAEVVAEAIRDGVVRRPALAGGRSSVTERRTEARRCPLYNWSGAGRT